MSITMIAVTEMNYGIGNSDNELLFNLPKDMAHFKAITSGKVVVMGRKTWESLPKKPLLKRKNYILTSDENYVANGAKIITSVEDVLKLSKTHEVFIIGGGNVYNQFMEHADKLIITHVHAIELSARVFFPQIDVREWKLVKAEKHDADEKHAHNFTFATYERKITN